MNDPMGYAWTFGSDGVNSTNENYSRADIIALKPELFFEPMQWGETISNFVNRIGVKLEAASETYPWALDEEVKLFVIMINLKNERRWDNIRRRLERMAYFACHRGDLRYLITDSGTVLTVDELTTILEYEDLLHRVHESDFMMNEENEDEDEDEYDDEDEDDYADEYDDEDEDEDEN